MKAPVFGGTSFIGGQIVRDTLAWFQEHGYLSGQDEPQILPFPGKICG